MCGEPTSGRTTCVPWNGNPPSREAENPRLCLIFLIGLFAPFWDFTASGSSPAKSRRDDFRSFAPDRCSLSWKVLLMVQGGRVCVSGCDSIYGDACWMNKALVNAVARHYQPSKIRSWPPLKASVSPSFLFLTFCIPSFISPTGLLIFITIVLESISLRSSCDYSLHSRCFYKPVLLLTRNEEGNLPPTTIQIPGRSKTYRSQIQILEAHLASQPEILTPSHRNQIQILEAHLPSQPQVLTPTSQNTTMKWTLEKSATLSRT